MVGRRLSERGADRAAAMTTLIATAKLNDVDPLAWLADALAASPTSREAGSTNLPLAVEDAGPAAGRLITTELAIHGASTCGLHRRVKLAGGLHIGALDSRSPAVRVFCGDQS